MAGYDSCNNGSVSACPRCGFRMTNYGPRAPGYNPMAAYSRRGAYSGRSQAYSLKSSGAYR